MRNTLGKAMNPLFCGKVEKGKLILEAPNRFRVHLSKYEGQYVEVLLRKKKSQRSIQQNRAYFGIAVDILCEHTGFSRDEMHDALKQKFASRVDDKTGLTIIESTADMDTVRFNKYYEQIQQWSAEFLNVYIPSPSEPPMFEL
ncbi:MAG: hypothetical protein Q8J68_14620 [Methanolobus sp.]|uniref:hypothetical protein n=1 Tax=Methanolobus sp. TaxID=1874737 RepID=UPI002731065A|nr:hypothetical protein [Methanolobus sp.]MDP2218508.1 hypothetical protein [Methanolobus sp.]